MTKKISLKEKLNRIFMIAFIVPMIALSLFSFYNSYSILKRNTETLTNINLKQVNDNLELQIDSYEDLLYQLYTSDEIVFFIDMINSGENTSIARKEIISIMNNLLNTKKYIRAITIITSTGEVVTYDQFATTNYKNSWLQNYSLNKNQLFNEISQDNKTHVFGTEYSSSFAGNDYYLFHIGHRIIDYRNLKKINGVVIISIDETFLSDICKTSQYGNNENNMNFIIDKFGKIISYPSKDKIKLNLFDGEKTLNEKKNIYKEFVKNEQAYDNVGVYVYNNANLGWDIVNVKDESGFVLIILKQFLINMAFCIFMMGIASLLIVMVSNPIVNSVESLVGNMQKASIYNLKSKTPENENMPIEIEMIAVQFNKTIEELEIAISKEMEAKELQRIAEIKSLEYQINPHFLYNTLDIINWMAIDKDELEISEAINILAKILRYSVMNSSEDVLIRDELNWLEEYISLQQIKYKNNFKYEVNVKENADNYKIYKLLLQPFVENSIIHGFENNSFKEMNKDATIIINVFKISRYINIEIVDNGVGIPDDVLMKFNNDIFDEEKSKTHIGMKNTITRLNMYYGNDFDIKIESCIGEGTCVKIIIPAIQ